MPPNNHHCPGSTLRTHSLSSEEMLCLITQTSQLFSPSWICDLYIISSKKSAARNIPTKWMQILHRKDGDWLKQENKPWSKLGVTFVSQRHVVGLRFPRSFWQGPVRPFTGKSLACACTDVLCEHGTSADKPLLLAGPKLFFTYMA